MAEQRVPQNADKYIVRFPDGMRARIAEAAKANNRSMNSEIVSRLEASFDDAPSDRAGAGPAPSAGEEAILRELAALRKEVKKLAGSPGLAGKKAAS